MYFDLKNILYLKYSVMYFAFEILKLKVHFILLELKNQNNFF